MSKKDFSVVLNAIRETSTDAYQNSVPIATAKNIADVGAAVLAAPTAIRNEFMENLYNKVGLTLIDTPVIENDFAFLKKGTLEYGQSIEDIYIGLATSEPYITGMGEGQTAPNPFEIRKLPHYSSFYSTILSRQYQLTRHISDLKKAFHSSTGMEQFIAGMMNSLVSAENLDDRRAAIGLLARQIEEAQKSENHKGTIHLVTEYNKLNTENPVTADTAMTDRNFIKFFINQVKKYSKRMRHPRKDLNIAGVTQVLPQSKQRIMMLEDMTTDIETELLAFAYNNDKFLLNGVDEIDSWYSIGASTAGVAADPDSIKVKSTFSTEDGGSTQCVALIYDTDMVKIYNKERIASEQANAKGNYWNIFMSLEDIYACSPYKNFVAFMLD